MRLKDFFTEDLTYYISVSTVFFSTPAKSHSLRTHINIFTFRTISASLSFAPLNILAPSCCTLSVVNEALLEAVMHLTTFTATEVEGNHSKIFKTLHYALTHCLAVKKKHTHSFQCNLTSIIAMKQNTFMLHKNLPKASQLLLMLAHMGSIFCLRHQPFFTFLEHSYYFLKPIINYFLSSIKKKSKSGHLH